MRLSILLLPACVAYGLNEKDEAPFDSGDPPPGDSGEPGDSGDSGDAGGRECATATPEATWVAVDDACAAGRTVEDPWNVVIEWDYYAGDDGSATMPAVGDLDGDGLPEVAVVEWFGNLSLLDGPTGARRWRRAGFDGTATPVVADVTGDGLAELLALGADHRLLAFDATGATVWISPILDYLAPNPNLTAADLDADGVAEVLVDDLILDGVSGAIEARVDSAKLYYTFRSPAVGDVDLDGVREVLIGNVIAAPDGTVRDVFDAPGALFTAAANLDGDAEAELVMTLIHELRIVEHDLTLRVSVPLDATLPGVPAVADFDGDGDPEIAVPDGLSLRLFEADGTEVWKADTLDVSGAAGASGFDVDGDGAVDVLFAGEDAFAIFDGRTGELRYVDADHDSQTLYEYPVVADVDGDGSAEILVASSRWHGGHLGVTAYGHAGGGWRGAGTTWGIHDFAVTNQGPEGEVPAVAPPPWAEDNCVRALPAAPPLDALPDLFLEVGDACVTTCADGGRVEIPWQAGNRGAAPSAAATVTLHVTRDDGEEAVASAPVPAIAAGEKAEGGVFVVDSAVFAGVTSYAARVDDAPEDCDSTNAAVAVEAALCP